MRITRLLLLAALAFPAVAPAQTRSAIDSARYAAIERLTHGTFVRAQVRGSEYTGSLVAYTRDDVFIRHHRDTLALPQQSISILEYAKGRATKKGAVIGGIIVAIPSAYLGLLVGCFMAENCGADGVYGAAVGALGGGTLGAIIGAGVGSAFTGWERAWP